MSRFAVLPQPKSTGENTGEPRERKTEICGSKRLKQVIKCNKHIYIYTYNSKKWTPFPKSWFTIFCSKSHVKTWMIFPIHLSIRKNTQGITWRNRPHPWRKPVDLQVPGHRRSRGLPGRVGPMWRKTPNYPVTGAVNLTSSPVPSSKLTWQWKITIFNRRYIFKRSIFHRYVSLLECIIKHIKFETLDFLISLRASEGRNMPFYWWTRFTKVQFEVTDISCELENTRVFAEEKHLQIVDFAACYVE